MQIRILNFLCSLILEGSDGDEEYQEAGNNLTVTPEEADEGEAGPNEGGEDAMEDETAGGVEFEDKEHESQFCLENNFSGEGEQEGAESTAKQEDKEGKQTLREM